MKSLHVVVHGVVQGVGFREWTRRQADRLGLAGWVRNLPEGTVELSASGPQQALDQLLQALEQGPRGARVERLEPGWSEVAEPQTGFHIR